MTENRNQTGDDVQLVIDGEKIPVTDKGWTWTQETAESNFDDSKHPNRSVTSRHLEGDLEYDGAKSALERKLINAKGSKHRLLFQEQDTGETYTILGVIIESIEKSYPGDGKSSVSISWTGERLMGKGEQSAN
jgi:hypothetical protein